MRLQVTREFYIPRGAIKVADKASDAVAYLHADKRERPCAAIFYGSRTRPVFNYAYTTEATREAAVRKAFEARRAHKKHVVASRANPSPTAKRNAAAKKALEAVYGRGMVHVKGGTGTAYGWLGVRFSFPAPKGATYGEREAAVVKILTEAGVELHSYDSGDYGSGYRLSLDWADA